MTVADETATTSRGLGRDTMVVTACTLLSRITGFGRVLATAAVLGSGVLGDVYQTANMIPNLLFELVALGVLQAVLLPSFVSALRNDGDRGLSEAVGASLGVILVGLGVLSAIGMAASPIIARVMVAFDPSSAVTAEKLDVLVPMALVFVPQLVFYGLAVTTSAALNARGHYLAAAIAPAVNNIVVIVACLLFRWSRAGAVADLDLSVLEFSLISIGTTLGVIAFGLVPALTLGARGIPWRPRWSTGHPTVRSMRDNFAWASLSVVGTFVPMAAALALGNGAEGGVAVFMFGFAFFVLPHALIAVPAATALAPRVAARWLGGDHDSLRADLDSTLGRVVPLLALGGAGLIALAWPIADVMAFGQIAMQGLEPIAYALVAFGLGLVGYGVSFVLGRALFALGDLRATSRRMVVGAIVGVAVMGLGSAVFPTSGRAAALAAGYGAAQSVTALLLWARLRELTDVMSPGVMLRRVRNSVVAAALTTAAMLEVTGRFGDRRRQSAAAIVAAGATGVALFGLMAAYSALRQRRS